MYKLFRASAYQKMEKTPEIFAVQHDSARVIPIWIYDLDFKNIGKGTYTQLSKPYAGVWDDVYKSTYTYYIKNSDNTYTKVTSLTIGTTYYLRKSPVRIVIRKPSGRRVVEDCELAPNYIQMETAYYVNNPEYKSTYQYYTLSGTTYTEVLFANLVVGTRYYRKMNTVVLVPLFSQALAECGTSIGQLQLDYSQEAGGGQITTFKFFLKVEKSYIDHAISVNERANINQLLVKLQEVIAELPTEEFTKDEIEYIWDNPLPVQLSGGDDVDIT